MTKDNKESNSELYKLISSYENDDFYIMGKREIQINTLGNIIPYENIENFRRELSKYDIEVKVDDNDGVVLANELEFSSIISIAMQTSILSYLIKSVGPNALWDCIKFFTVHSWKSIQGEKYIKYSSDKVEKDKEVTLNFTARIHNNKYTFIYEGLSPTEVEKATDKILDFFREQDAYDNWRTYIVQYNKGEEKWEMKELSEILRNSK